MSGEDELDAQAGDRAVKIVSRNTRCDQPSKGIVTGSSLRPTLGISLILTATADPVVLFRDVREIQEVGEGPGNRDRGVERQGSQIVRQVPESILVAVTGGFCRCPDLLDDLVEAVPFERPKGVAQQFSQQSHIVAQRLVRIVHTAATITPTR